MDDERKKPHRKGGPKSSAAGRGGDRPRPSGKAGFAGKPRAEGGKKPFRARREDAGEANAERPQRDFKRDDRPRETGGNTRPGHIERTERTGDAAPSGRGGERPRPSGKAGFAGKPRAEGGKKPFRPRRDDVGEARAERPQRDFKRDDRPRDSGNSRPGRFERSERTGDGAPSGRGERPFRAGAEGKPYGKRPQRDGEPSTGGRHFKRGDRPQGDRRPKFADHGDRKPFARGSDAAGAGEEGERIAKRLARVGIASRRDAEELIAAGRIRVNGKVLSSPAFNVSPGDTVELDGTAIPPIERTRLFLFHKPAGLVTTNRDPEGRRTVFDVLPKESKRSR